MHGLKAVAFKTWLDADEFRLNRSCYDSPPRLRQHIDFAAHSKFREVDARFHGEAGVGQDQALVVSFEVVQVSSVAVGLGGDAMPRPMREVRSEAGVADHHPGCVVGLPPRYWRAGSKRILHCLDRCIPCLGHQGEDLALSFVWLTTDHSGPGNVVEAGSGAIHASPDVDEQEIAFAD